MLDNFTCVANTRLLFHVAAIVKPERLTYSQGPGWHKFAGVHILELSAAC